MAVALANTTGWLGTYGPVGPQSFTPTVNTNGNLLVLFAAWDVMFASSISAPIPVSSVADSSRNFWRQGADTGNAFPNCRCAIWYCPNAMPIARWASFALSGYASALQFMLCEFSGLPANYYPLLDFGPFTSQNALTTTLTATATATVPDYVFGMGAAGTTGSTITPPGGSWVSLTSGSTGGANPNGIEANAAWETVAAGSVTGTWTYAISTYAAACVMGLSQANTGVPAQVSPTTPNFRTSLALGATPGNSTSAITEDQWVDISSRSFGPGKQQLISSTRGQEYELAQPESGVIEIALSNQDGAFNPDSPGSPFYSNAINQNMSFQYAVAPWTVSAAGTSFSRSSVQAFASGYGSRALFSCLISGNGVVTQPGIQSEMMPVKPNVPYQASCWGYSPTAWAAGVQTGVNWFTSVGGYISSSFSGPTALPAATWVNQISNVGEPPATAAFAQQVIQILGTPANAAPFYLAEGALAPNPPGVQTGLVRQGTPVRLQAWWNGRMYSVSMGFVERWPQDWPEIPQWGFSKMVATDVVGVAANTQLSSAVQGEILADGAYACFPFNEQYSVSQNTLNGVVRTAGEADGLQAMNTSRLSPRASVYKDGVQPLVTGQSLGFIGDSGTGMGTSGYSTPDFGSAFRGGGATYGPDPSLPNLTTSTGSTFEFWVQVPTMANSPSVPREMQIFQLLGYPYINSGTSGGFGDPGFLFSFGVYNPTSGSPQWCSLLGWNSVIVTYAGTMTYNVLHHVVITINNLNIQVFVDGVSVGAFAMPAARQVIGIDWGQTQFPYGYNTLGGLINWNYAMAYGSVYSYTLPQARIVAHYNSGIAGFQGDSTMARMGRYLAWAGTGILPAGPGVTDNMQLGPAYSTANSPLSSALNADCKSSGARWLANACGNLVMIPRPARYNQANTITFGENVVGGEVPYEPTQGFDYDNQYVQNVQQAQLVQGPNSLAAPIVKDPTSINQYFQRGPTTMQISGASQQDAYDAANWNLFKYRQPSLRARSLVVDLASRPASITTVLQSDLGDSAVINRRPLGGLPYQVTTTIQRMTWNVGPGVFEVGYQASPYVPENAVLTTDGSNDVLGSNSLAW